MVNTLLCYSHYSSSPLCLCFIHPSLLPLRRRSPVNACLSFPPLSFTILFLLEPCILPLVSTFSPPSAQLASSSFCRLNASLVDLLLVFFFLSPAPSAFLSFSLFFSQLFFYTTFLSSRSLSLPSSIPPTSPSSIPLSLFLSIRPSSLPQIKVGIRGFCLGQGPAL